MSKFRGLARGLFKRMSVSCMFYVEWELNRWKYLLKGSLGYSFLKKSSHLRQIPTQPGCYACCTLIGSWEGGKNFRVGIF